MDQFPNIFKAYDIRGLVDTEIDADFAFATGMAFARFLQIEREPGTIVIGEDMRPSSPELADAFSAGVTSQGMDVIRIGLASTDMLYFASGKLGVLLAIECLDEGVDIPSARIGIILASSGNTKEFIQRRGRLMRPFAGKSQADIYDFCVLPEDPQDPLNTLGLMEVELNRIIEFGSDALNAQEIYALVESKKTDRGV